MTVFLVVIVFALVAVAAKRWFGGGFSFAWLKNHSKKQEEDDKKSSQAKVEIVVDQEANSSKNGKDADKTARKSLLSKPPRYEGPRSPVGSMEVSIRSALNELRSRQVVKNICSKFEARVAKHAVMPDDDGEEACIRAVNGGEDEYLQPAQAQQLRREERSITPAPFASRRTSNGAKPNNLNAFLRRYSSNLERANFDETADSSSSSNDPELVAAEAPPAALEASALIAAPDAFVPPPIPVSAPAPATRKSFSLQSELDLLDLQSTSSDDISNQCDSPVRSSLTLAFEISPAAESEDGGVEEPAEDCGDHGDWDVTCAKEPQQQQAPEECPADESKFPRLPAVRNSVARFQQFQQQIPSNHARTSSFAQQ